MSINKQLKAKALEGYCCEMDSGPLKRYLKHPKLKRRVRNLLKRLTRKEIREQS